MRQFNSIMVVSWSLVTALSASFAIAQAAGFDGDKQPKNLLAQRAPGDVLGSKTVVTTLYVISPVCLL